MKTEKIVRCKKCRTDLGYHFGWKEMYCPNCDRKLSISPVGNTITTYWGWRKVKK